MHIVVKIHHRALSSKLGWIYDGDIVVIWTGYHAPRLNIKTVLSTYGDFHVKDKTS